MKNINGSLVNAFFTSAAKKLDVFSSGARTARNRSWVRALRSAIFASALLAAPTAAIAQSDIEAEFTPEQKRMMSLTEKMFPDGSVLPMDGAMYHVLGYDRFTEYLENESSKRVDAILRANGIDPDSIPPSEEDTTFAEFLQDAKDALSTGTVHLAVTSYEEGHEDLGVCTIIMPNNHPQALMIAANNLHIPPQILKSINFESTLTIADYQQYMNNYRIFMGCTPSESLVDTDNLSDAAFYPVYHQNTRTEMLAAFAFALSEGSVDKVRQIAYNKAIYTLSIAQSNRFQDRQGFNIDYSGIHFTTPALLALANAMEERFSRPSTDPGHPSNMDQTQIEAFVDGVFLAHGFDEISYRSIPGMLWEVSSQLQNDSRIHWGDLIEKRDLLPMDQQWMKDLVTAYRVTFGAHAEAPDYRSLMIVLDKPIEDSEIQEIVNSTLGTPATDELLPGELEQVRASIEEAKSTGNGDYTIIRRQDGATACIGVLPERHPNRTDAIAQLTGLPGASLYLMDRFTDTEFPNLNQGYVDSFRFMRFYRGICNNSAWNEAADKKVITNYAELHSAYQRNQHADVIAALFLAQGLAGESTPANTANIIRDIARMQLIGVFNTMPESVVENYNRQRAQFASEEEANAASLQEVPESIAGHTYEGLMAAAVWIETQDPARLQSMDENELYTIAESIAEDNTMSQSELLSLTRVIGNARYTTRRDGFDANNDPDSSFPGRAGLLRYALNKDYFMKNPLVRDTAFKTRITSAFRDALKAILPSQARLLTPAKGLSTTIRCQT